MKWGSLLWLCYAAAEIGRQPKPPLTEEQKRRRQQYVADKKIKRARQLKRMRWEVQQRRLLSWVSFLSGNIFFGLMNCGATRDARISQSKRILRVSLRNFFLSAFQKEFP